MSHDYGLFKDFIKVKYVMFKYTPYMVAKTSDITLHVSINPISRPSDPSSSVPRCDQCGSEMMQWSALDG